MKPIVILTLLQVTVLAVLVLRIILVEDQLDEMTIQSRQSPEKVFLQPVEKSVTAVPDGPGFDENRLRQLIRSEIRSELNQHAVSITEAPSDSPKELAAIDPVENARRLDLTKQTLSSYIERGEISDIEMQEFQMQISQLDPHSTTIMIKALVRALNSGELKGRL